jgi:Domain of unknown function (DUF4282)
MTCARCGNTEPEDAVYCSNCGAPLASQFAPGPQTAMQGPDAIKTATVLPPQVSQVSQQASHAQEDHERVKAAGLPKPQQGQDVSGSRGFLASLFDFGFNSFVTPKVVKAVYVLAMILIALWLLAFAVAAFAVNRVLGIAALFILCPILFIVELALWRLFLELVMVIFRIADDVRDLRARRDVRPDRAEVTGIPG